MLLMLVIRPVTVKVYFHITKCVICVYVCDCAWAHMSLAVCSDVQIVQAIGARGIPTD